MATIKEDYVSFETAKLLKEKGFNEECFALYNPDGMLIQSGIRLNNIQVGRVKGSYSAPTLQMAMKWLREVHDLFIDTYYDCDFSEGYRFSVHKLPKGTTLETNNENYSTYEEACEAAIKYCLKKLNLNNYGNN